MLSKSLVNYIDYFITVCFMNYQYKQLSAIVNFLLEVLKVRKLLLVLVSAVFIAACGSDKNSNEAIQKDNQEVKETTETIDPSYIIKAFKDNNLPVGNVVIHTAKSDPNKLLGRPDGYKASAHFEDMSVEQDQPIVDGEVVLPKGGSIEIWENNELAEARKSYIDEVTKSMNMPALKQYMYIHDGILLRLEYDITPDQAEKYANTLNSL